MTRSDHAESLAPYLQAERAAAILTQGQYRPLNLSEIGSARRYLEGALSAIDLGDVSGQADTDQLHLPL